MIVMNGELSILEVTGYYMRSTCAFFSFFLADEIERHVLAPKDWLDRLCRSALIPRKRLQPLKFYFILFFSTVSELPLINSGYSPSAIFCCSCT